MHQKAKRSLSNLWKWKVTSASSHGVLFWNFSNWEWILRTLEFSVYQNNPHTCVNFICDAGGVEYSNDCGEHLWSLYPSKKGQSLIVNNSRQLTHPTLHVTYITKRHVKNIFLTYEFNLSTAVWCCCDCCCSSDGFQEPIHPTLLLTGEVYIWHQLVHEQNGFSCLGFISVHLVHWQGKKVDDETDQSLSSISSSSFHCQSPS